MEKQSGFSLIELLISMTILILVIFIGSFSFSIFSKLWSKGNTEYHQLVEQGQANLLMARTFSDVSNYLVHDEDGRPFYYFEGNSQSVSFVTRFPLITGAEQALVQFSVEPGEKVEGIELQHLVYREVELIGADFFNIRAFPTFTHKKVLLSSENIRFNYYGWATSAERLKRYDYDENVSPRWQPTYSATTSGMLPYIVNITWADNEPVLFSVRTDEALRIELTQEKFKGE